MIPRMRPARRHLALVPMLALSLWAALPWVEWCSMSWRECTERCAATAIASCAESAACAPRACAVAAASACGAADAPCGSAVAAPEPEPGSEPAPRAWCLHAPIAGVGPRGVALELPVDHAPLARLSPPLPEVGAPHAAVRVALDRRAPHPAVRDPHAPPLGRAPPRA